MKLITNKYNILLKNYMHINNKHENIIINSNIYKISL